VSFLGILGAYQKLVDGRYPQKNGVWIQGQLNGAPGKKGNLQPEGYTFRGIGIS
jgi:hypothetical protein